MAKSGGRTRPAKASRSSKVALASDMFDDVEVHREKALQLDADQSGEDIDSEDDAPVMDLDGQEADSDADSDDDEGNAKLAKIIAAQKAMKRQLALARGEDDEDEEGSEDDERQWGSKKSMYYHAEDVDVDFDSDDEAAAEEGEEALRLQKEAAQQMLPQDLGLDDDDDDDEDDDDEQGQEVTLAAAAKAKEGVLTERIRKQVGDMSASEKLEAVAHDAPELLSLLSDLKGNLHEVRSRIAPVLHEVQQGGLATQEGISCLEAKHMLLLGYCMCVMFYMRLKLEGRPVREHPVIARLVQIRAYLDKLRPIDKRLEHQISKLLKASEMAASGAAAAGASGEDPLSFRPNPDALVSKLDAADEDGTAVYRPPKLNPVSMDDPAKDRQLASERRRQKDALRKALSNSFIRDLTAEVTGGPEELQATAAGMDTIEAIKEKQRMDSRTAVEEDLMVRVPLTKEERKRSKALQRAGLSGRAVLDDFADDVADLLGAHGGAGDAADPFMARMRLNQKHGADLASAAPRAPSGDAELPMKADLGVRRAKYDAVRAQQAAQLSAMETEARSLKRPRVEDEFYQQAKSAVEAKKKAKKAKSAHPELRPPVADPLSAAPRKVSTAIEKNRGLTPHRRKDQKNPRKHAQAKFTKAETRRKGQVQSVKTPDGPYHGEATGIKSRVSKSVRL